MRVMYQWGRFCIFIVKVSWEVDLQVDVIVLLKRESHKGCSLRRQNLLSWYSYSQEMVFKWQGTKW